MDRDYKAQEKRIREVFPMEIEDIDRKTRKILKSPNNSSKKTLNSLLN